MLFSINKTFAPFINSSIRHNVSHRNALKSGEAYRSQCAGDAEIQVLDMVHCVGYLFCHFH